MSDQREIAAGKAAAPTADRASSSCRGGGLRPNWGGDGAARSGRREPDPNLGCPPADASYRLVRKMEIRTVMQQPSA
jgi:hypothetical protein